MPWLFQVSKPLLLGVDSPSRFRLIERADSFSFLASFERSDRFRHFRAGRLSNQFKPFRLALFPLQASFLGDDLKKTVLPLPALFLTISPSNLVTLSLEPSAAGLPLGICVCPSLQTTVPHTGPGYDAASRCKRDVPQAQNASPPEGWAWVSSGLPLADPRIIPLDLDPRIFCISIALRILAMSQQRLKTAGGDHRVNTGVLSNHGSAEPAQLAGECRHQTPGSVIDDGSAVCRGMVQCISRRARSPESSSESLSSCLVLLRRIHRCVLAVSEIARELETNLQVQDRAERPVAGHILGFRSISPIWSPFFGALGREAWAGPVWSSS